MRYWFSLVSMMTLLLFTPLSHANNPLALGNTGSKTSINESQLNALNIHALKADWWKPLTEPDYRDAFSEKLLNQLDLSWQEADVSEREVLEDSIQSIKRALNTFKRLTDLPDAGLADMTNASQDSYTWSDWLEALRNNQALQTLLNENSNELLRQEAGQKLLSRQVDDLTANYLSSDTSQSVKLALELIEKRLNWLITQESVRLEKSQLNVVKLRAEATERQFKRAQERLVISDADLNTLQQQAKQLETSIEQTQEKLRESQATLPTIIGDDILTRAKQQQAKVTLLSMQLLLIQKQTQYTWNRLSQTYLQRHQASDSHWTDEQRRFLSDSTNELDPLNQQKFELRQLIERYRDQSQSSLALLSTLTSSRELTQSRRIYEQLLELTSDLLTQQQALSQQLTDNSTLLTLLRHQLRQSDGRLKGSLNDLGASAEDLWHTTLSWLNISLFKMGETPVTTAGIVRIVLIIMAVWWFSYWLRKAITRLARRNQKIADATIYTLNRVLHYLIMLIGIMVALSSIGLDFSSVAWIAGALSVGIGFGLQSIVNNFVSGLIIMFERSLKVGDFLELQSGMTGTVSQINMRSTIIRTPDNLEIVVPNSEFISGRVVNWTLTDNERRLRIPFSVEYGTDKEQVVHLVMQAAHEVPYTLNNMTHEPQVWMTRMGDNGLEFELLVWVRQGVDMEVRRADSRQGLTAAYLWEIESALRNAGIGMPFPQRDYYIRSILGENTVAGFVQALNALKSVPISTTTQQQRPS